MERGRSDARNPDHHPRTGSHGPRRLQRRRQGRAASIVAAAVGAAGLVETLQSEGPFTVFAPTNAAFAKLPKETVEALMSDAGKAQLGGILTYHVVPGSVKAADVVKLTEAKTAQGQSVKIKVQDGKVFIDGAQVIVTDIECSNGIIHVIDSVILPSAK
jgi:uncharacterized surface protein with fasciclin (FAS1) repeats